MSCFQTHFFEAKIIGNNYEKKIAVTVYTGEYERNNKRVKSKYGRLMKAKRQSTVEPVWGTLTQFMGLRKINTIGIEQANKVMQMAAMAYNLKKLLKFIAKNTQTVAMEARVSIFHFFGLVRMIFGPFEPVKS
jgi:hypothetical protein